MDVKLSSTTLSSNTTGKQFDFCDDLSEHGYGSLEDLNCPTATNGSSTIQGCDLSSSSLPTAATTTTITSSPPSSSPPLSSTSSIDSIASLNISSSSSTKSSSEPASTSSPEKECNASHGDVKTTGDQNSDKNNPINVNSSTILDNSSKESNHRCKENSSGEPRNDQKLNDGKVQSPSPQMFQSGNRFRFVPKNRQTNTNDLRSRNGTFQSNGRSNNRVPRKGSSRSESDYVENKKRSQMRNKNNEDIVFIIRRVDRSLRRTVSESSGETLPVRGILKYPRGWNRRTKSESNCDNSEQSNLMDSHENGQTQSLECISPLEASCEASTESACSSAGEQSPGHDEEKPKKSVHFNCYVSKATFNINSTILNNKHSGSNKKKNRRHHNNNHPSSNNNDQKNATTNSNSKQNTNNKNHKDNHPNKHPNHSNSRWKSQQSNLNQHSKQNQLEPSNNQTKSQTTKPLTDQSQSVNCDTTNKNEIETIVTDSVIISNAAVVDKEDQSENIDPMETKLRSRQDSGYDSETSDRKGFVEDSGTTTCVKSPNRQFTVKKVDLN